jgi:hypothetical protein
MGTGGRNEKKLSRFVHGFRLRGRSLVQVGESCKAQDFGVLY